MRRYTLTLASLRKAVSSSGQPSTVRSSSSSYNGSDIEGEMVFNSFGKVVLRIVRLQFHEAEKRGDPGLCIVPVLVADRHGSCVSGLTSSSTCFSQSCPNTILAHYAIVCKGTGSTLHGSLVRSVLWRTHVPGKKLPGVSNARSLQATFSLHRKRGNKKWHEMSI